MVRQPSRSEWSHIQALFAELIDLDPAAQEHRLAAEDDFISGQLRALLAASRNSGILDGAAPSSFETAPRRAYSSLSEGAVIGGFTIDRLIGRGGMGEVYAAHRSDRMFDQQVAIKLLRPESVAHSELFDRERRLLAGLEHPGIARLIDGGVAPDGRPYMAMEYVTGEPIDAWCRTHDADLATRLRLFCDVCEAVAYAHSHLIVHRDLKPSNILVDSDGRARLLDFGIARFVEIEGEGEAQTTIALMTPDYAAPEQLGNAAPTVATDVYALGVLLFELLTGRSPWREPGSALPSVIRRILNDDPPLPSALVPPGYPFGRREVAGDLDAIVLKAMRRAPQDRYRGVGELVDDVRSHMALRPVAARSGSAGYTIGRYLRRHRVATATAIERDVALAEARRSESINRMLTVMFRDTASSAVGEEATVKQMLDQTAAQLVASVDRSAKSATLITTLADLYVNLEDAAGADALLTSIADNLLAHSPEGATSLGIDTGARAAMAVRLGYPVSAQQYFAGFVLDADDRAQWAAIAAAADAAEAAGVARAFIWALPQVARDGFICFDGEDAVQAFDAVDFPLAIGREAMAATEFSTQIVSSPSGHEQRASEWAEARMRYDAGPGIRSEADVRTLAEFFRARRGAARAFRFRDPFDHASAGDGGAPEPGDQLLGEGDGETRLFALVKHYGAGDAEQERVIRLPVAGSVRVAVGGVEAAAFVVTGEGAVLLDEAPAAGAVVTAGFLFDVPVRFADDRLEVSRATFLAGEIASVPLIEVRAPW